MPRRRWWVALVLLACAGLPGCKVPPYVGLIRFETRDGACKARATSLDVDLAVVKKAYWLVFNDCENEQKQVRVGNFVSGTDEYDVVKCMARSVNVPPQGLGMIDCTVEINCDRRYKYSVYVDSSEVVDPELRVKGNNRLPSQCALPPLPARQGGQAR